MQNIKVYKQNTKPDEIRLKYDHRPYKIIKEKFYDNLLIVKNIESNEFKVVKIETEMVVDNNEKEVQLEYMVPIGHFPHNLNLSKERIQQLIAYYMAILEYIEKEESEYGLKEK